MKKTAQKKDTSKKRSAKAPEKISKKIRKDTTKVNPTGKSNIKIQKKPSKK